MKKEYLVEGMTCSGCERAVQGVISRLEGVSAVEADFKSSTVSVAYDPEKVDVEEIRSVVGRVGYKFVGERPAHGQREGRDDAVS